MWDDKMNDFNDPARRWAHLLGALEGYRREAVVSTLRNSADGGWGSSTEGVRLLIGYAKGDITAHQYADGILRSLGVDPRAPISAAAPTEPDPEWTREWDEPLEWGSLEPDPDLQPELPGEWRVPAGAVTEPPSRVVRREEAVRDYMSGRIPMEEFLRLVEIHEPSESPPTR